MGETGEFGAAGGLAVVDGDGPAKISAVAVESVSAHCHQSVLVGNYDIQLLNGTARQDGAY